MLENQKSCPTCQNICGVEDSFCSNCRFKFREVQPGDWFFNDTYLLEDLIGEGGMGSVWKAQRIVNPETKSTSVAAVKFLHRHYSEGRPDVVKMFEDEAEILKELRNSHIVHLYNYGNDPSTGLFFIGMDHVRGHTLEVDIKKKRTYLNEQRSGKLERERTIRENPLPLERITDIMQQTLQAIEFVHNKNVYHRDLKPSNLMVEPDGVGKEHVYVLDFGIARFLEAEQKGQGRTSMQSIMGTYPYMSPEHFNGTAYGPESDIFALGIIMYEMLTGTKPFGGDDDEMPTTIMNRIENHEHPDVTQLLIPPTKQFSKAIAKILTKALAKKPENRYRSCLDFNAAIEDLTKPQIPLFLLTALGLVISLALGFIVVKMVIE